MIGPTSSSNDEDGGSRVHDFPAIGDSFGRFSLLRILGRGGMGVVYEAHDPALDRSVALKILLPSLSGDADFQHRFEREAATLARVRSRHIVSIHDFGSHEGAAYLVTAFLPDGDLQQHLSKRGPLDAPGALGLLSQVCEALQDAHAAGVVHRDVKPRNVMLWRRPTGAAVAYLGDFGIAVARDDADATSTQVAGSPGYMAPERIRGEPTTPACDIYSAGCLLHTAVTGHPPFPGSDERAIDGHLNRPVPQVRTGSPADPILNAMLAQTMAKDPERRFRSATALGNAAHHAMTAMTQGAR